MRLVETVGEPDIVLLNVACLQDRNVCTCCYCPKHGAYSKSVQTKNEKLCGKLSRESDQQIKIDEKPQTILSLNQTAVDNLIMMLNSLEMDIDSILDKLVKNALKKHVTNVMQSLSSLICVVREADMPFT
uniref:Uncharacterized protein n=1 Tax=Romanomermis culicivorax TaxID=13658 RepID=A0A915IFC0_ROMCU